jgi:hypothetical protein
MTSHVGRLYALALALVLFFLMWAVVAARPWSAQAADPRLKALTAREVRLRREARLVNRVVTRRWALYHKELRARTALIAAVKARIAQQQAAAQRQVVSYAAPAASPSVRVVTLPPLTITRTS